MTDIIRTDPRVTQTNESAESQNAPIKSQPQALDRLIRPHSIAGSLYHHYISKNLPLTNLKEEDVGFVMLFEDTVNIAIYLETQKIVTDDISNDIASLADTWFNAKRAIGGETMKLISTQNVRITELSNEDKPSASGRFIGGKQ